MSARKGVKTAKGISRLRGIQKAGRPEGQKDVSRTLAFAEGVMVAVTTERWSALVNVTVRVSSAVCAVLVLYPWPGTAEIRHTPRLP